jgi:hypothetical protein
MQPASLTRADLATMGTAALEELADTGTELEANAALEELEGRAHDRCDPSSGLGCHDGLDDYLDPWHNYPTR